MEYVLESGVLFVVAITEVFSGALLSIFNIYEIQSLKPLYLLITLVIYLTMLVLLDPKRRAGKPFPTGLTVLSLFAFIACLTIFIYLQQTRTYDYNDHWPKKPFRLVRGEILSDSARLWAGNHPTDFQLQIALAQHGGADYNALLWDEHSYNDRKLQLLGTYGLVIVCYAQLMSLLAIALSRKEEKFMTPLDKATVAAENALLEWFKGLIKQKPKQTRGLSEEIPSDPTPTPDTTAQ